MRSFLAPPPDRPIEPADSAPTFSVVVAAYQVADVVSDALESLRQQTAPPHEVIVCDDGSTDALEEALAPYRDEIVFVRKSHGGEASAKNAAAARASGDFVVILDADDAFLPTRLEALAELAQLRPDLDILTTDAYLVADGRRVRRNYDRRWRFEVADQRRAILQRNFVFGHAAVRRERLLEHGGFDEAILWTTDWDLWLRLILDGSRVGAVDEPLALYHLRETSLTAQRRELALGKISTLEKAARSNRLEPGERAVVEAAIAAHRREVQMLDVRAAIAAGDSDARSRALAAARGSGSRARDRLQALVMGASPELSRRMLRRQAARSWVGAGGTRVTKERGGARAIPARSAGSQTRASVFRHRPLRILAYTDTEALGGADLALSHLLASLDGVIEAIVVGVNGEIAERVAAARPTTAVGVVPHPQSGSDVRSLVAHVKAVRAFAPDVLHASLASPWSCQYAIAAAAIAKTPAVVAVYQLPRPALSGRQRLTKRLTRRAVDRHVGVGERTSREVEQLLNLDPGSVQTIHNGVPDVRIERPMPRPAPGPIIGTIGRMEQQKGFDVLLRSLVDVPDCSLVVVGEGSERQALQTLACDLGVDRRVVWAGWNDDPRAWLPAFDVWVLPSRFEGFPLALLEALLAESAVAATDVGSVAEVVRDGETGLLVPPEDPAALAAAIRRLLRDEPLRSRLGAGGRRLVLERFTADHMARSFSALYDELLA
jgi:glycosyltransferase involved in cell wall biosynthesis